MRRKHLREAVTEAVYLRGNHWLMSDSTLKICLRAATIGRSRAYQNAFWHTYNRKGRNRG